jgi:two-component system LytT family sensor kinase
MVHLSVANLVGQTCGFAIGTALATLLLVLVCRFGGTHSRIRLFFAACLLIANCAGLAKNLVLLWNASADLALLEQMRAIGFAAAAMLPVCLVILWRDEAVTSARRRAGDLLLLYAVASSTAIAAALGVGAWCQICLSRIPQLAFLSKQDSVGNFTFYNGLTIVVLACFIVLPGSFHRRTTKIGLFLVVAGLALSSLSALLDEHASLPAAVASLIRVTRFQSSILVVVGVLVLFSRFRAADMFAKYAIRLLLAAGLSLSASAAIFGFLNSANQTTPSGRAAGIVVSAAIVAGAMLLYLFVGKHSDVFVERRIFGRRDVREVVREFRDRLELLASKEEVLFQTGSTAAEYLGVHREELSVQAVSPGNDDSAATSVPIPCEGTPMTLLVALSGEKRMVLMGEIETLREICLHTGRRLGELDRERERIESARMESRLSEQLAQAELIALRAQVNPHFLFNSLNTIASLIASRPKLAESITVRLANVFRYVLLHANLPFTSLDEELSFLRTYLDVEGIRFGQRLQVEFDIESSVSHLAIPSLILQPLVENAIKHGIARKVGSSKIVVRTRRRDNSLLVIVEDNGVGLGSKTNGSHSTGNGTKTGFGLRSIRERLHTLYGVRASLSLADIPSGGTRAALELPIEE